MFESGKNDFILKKSYEISYAIWRIAENAQERQFADKLFEKAVSLVGFSTEGDFATIAGKLPGLETFIRFGLDTNSIGSQNAQILFKEIGNLKAAISEKVEIDISEIFASSENESEAFEELEPEPETQETQIDIDNGNDVGNKAEIRQSAILDRIRQMGNCRLGDIQAVLPDISDRTIRYDLESLLERNLVERIGTGGRSVYYRIRQ